MQESITKLSAPGGESRVRERRCFDKLESWHNAIWGAHTRTHTHTPSKLRSRIDIKLVFADKLTRLLESALELCSLLARALRHTRYPAEIVNAIDDNVLKLCANVCLTDGATTTHAETSGPTTSPGHALRQGRAAGVHLILDQCFDLFSYRLCACFSFIPHELENSLCWDRTVKH